jgi:hypothetical protein
MLFQRDEDVIVHNHAVVRLGESPRRKGFKLGLETVDERTIHADLAAPHLHHRASTIGSGKVEGDSAFLPRIDEFLEGCEAVLVGGPETRRRCC